MKKSILFFSLLIASLSADVGYSPAGTDYGTPGVSSYAHSRHGEDGALFLDPFLTNALKNLSGKNVLDAGCGAGPWTVLAAENGAHVHGIDLQVGMISLAEQAVKEAGVQHNVALTVGDVAQLPYKNDSFDLALSINVGCNLPSGGIAFDKEQAPYPTGLGAHFKEMARVLKKGGTCIVTAPTSFGVVFSDGACDEDIYIHLASVLTEIAADASPQSISSNLQQLSEIYRATFQQTEERFWVVRNEDQLNDGDQIWRKIPGLAVPNIYHSEAEYLRCFREAGLKLEKFLHPCFSSDEEWETFLAQHPEAKIGDEYVSNPPFVIFYLRK
ncbi:MAG: class I SAM-dependent methyltransferase [Candidatus Melainabacteria bacterium]|nr:class I SAM-dependent methyltransferase [Candidatus Melainabacteria bacterium]